MEVGLVPDVEIEEVVETVVLLGAEETDCGYVVVIILVTFEVVLERPPSATVVSNVVV
jgi:hypothetical protein